MKLVFSQGGERDLEQIVDHIARALVRNPEGRPRANFDSRIRRSVHRGYNLYYAILPGEIRILAAIHGSRADDAVLFDLVKR